MQSKHLSLDLELKHKSNWSVRLGPAEWVKHTYERSAKDPIMLLGSARKGMQSGALAKLGSEFVQVVGDHITKLSKADNKELEKAITRAQAYVHPSVYQPAPARTSPAPVVIIKKRRVPVLPVSGSTTKS
ncbi:MAG: hypothetical protein JZU64_05030 [Rhodoferax sp.]|jgi:hypothetical protein|nr:hypothetical protein [Rhodoferax sp.]